MQMAMSDLDANPLLLSALSCAARGWPVFPLHTPVTGSRGSTCSCRRDDCQNIGKHPRTLKGLTDASIDPAQIRLWWEKFPEANVGLRTGNCLVVLDVDPKSGGDESLDAFEAANGKLPHTPTSLTGSGGRHFLFSSEDVVRNSAGLIGPGLDIRGDGGYIVAPPSLHASGKRYEWELSSTPDETPIAPMPAPLRAAATRKRAGKSAASDPVSETIGEGERNDTMFRLAASLRSKGLTEDGVRAALLVENVKRCVPPLDEVEVVKIAESVAKYAPGHSAEFDEQHPPRTRLRVVKDGPTGGGSGGPPPAPTGGGILDRGDAVELAQYLLLDLRGDSPDPVVYDRSGFWRYDDTTGTFTLIDPAVVYRTVAGYAGRFYRTKDGPKPLKLSDTAITGAIKAASQFAAQPGFFNEAPSGLAFRNGFVVVSGGTIRMESHGPEHRALHAMEFDYDATAQAPRWSRFLAEVFTYPDEAGMPTETQSAVSSDRAGRIGLLQEHAGACLVGIAVDHAACLVLTGEGANGKSVYLQCIKALFPSAATSSIAPQLWENRFYLAELAGVRLNAVAELPERDILESETFKAVVGGDALMVARKHQRPFTLRSIAGHLFACNALPGTKDQSDGFWRRFLVVPFERRFTEAERDLTLARKLVSSELPGIAAWAIEGARRLQERGRYEPPASSIDAKQEWQRESDQVRQFIEECTADGGRMSPTRAFESYAFWSKRTGHAGLSRGRFWKRLSKLCVQQSDGVERYYERSIKPDWVPSSGRYA
jgi:putative DNA primase/helicase